jgi:type II secretory pathway predicted ATPase ExeA
MIDRVQAFYGLQRPPFGRDLAPGMLHKHASHNEAVARITWCITNHALGVVTGEVGAGKTVALRAAVAGLDPARYTTIYVPNPAIGMRGLYESIVATLGGSPSYRTASLMAQANDALAAEVTERGRVPIIVLDESHLLAHEELDAVRMITNCEMDSTTPFAVLMIGQPTLRKKMKLGVLAALDQRIAVRCQMLPMDLEETASYVKHHTKLAGRSDALFSDDAVHMIHTTGRGLPRAVNNLALQSLVAAFTAEKSIVDEASARIAVSEFLATD